MSEMQMPELPPGYRFQVEAVYNSETLIISIQKQVEYVGTWPWSRPSLRWIPASAGERKVNATAESVRIGMADLAIRFGLIGYYPPQQLEASE